MRHLQHDVTSAAFGSPNTEQKQTTWTPVLLCLERLVFSAVPACQLETARQPERDRPSLQPRGPHPTPGPRPPFQKKKKMRGGNRMWLTHTYTHTQAPAKVSTNPWQPLGR